MAERKQRIFSKFEKASGAVASIIALGALASCSPADEITPPDRPTSSKIEKMPSPDADADILTDKTMAELNSQAVGLAKELITDSAKQAQISIDKNPLLNDEGSILFSKDGTYTKDFGSGPEIVSEHSGSEIFLDLNNEVIIVQGSMSRICYDTEDFVSACGGNSGGDRWELRFSVAEDAKGSLDGLRTLDDVMSALSEATLQMASTGDLWLFSDDGKNLMGDYKSSTVEMEPIEGEQWRVKTEENDKDGLHEFSDAELAFAITDTIKENL